MNEALFKESQQPLDSGGERPQRSKKLTVKKRSRDPNDKDSRKKQRSQKLPTSAPSSKEPALTAAQQMVSDQMRKALEEDCYSANGSVVDADSDDEEEDVYYVCRSGQRCRLDRQGLQRAARRHCFPNDAVPLPNQDKPEPRRNPNKPSNVTKYRQETVLLASAIDNTKKQDPALLLDPLGLEETEDLDRDGGSIFGASVGASNSTWVECDKCKKWRRLRGVVDEKKLPPKWYCTMNKNDPERSKCSAPEEEYETPHTPESAADARVRKHLRVWVRRLHCNEQYEARQPSITRSNKKRQTTSSKEPYEWIRCCNPSCGKWRALLRMMDAHNVMERTNNREWYCVMNTWDEKSASCAAPQETLPAIHCPSWVMQDDF